MYLLTTMMFNIRGESSVNEGREAVDYFGNKRRKDKTNKDFERWKNAED